MRSEAAWRGTETRDSVGADLGPRQPTSGTMIVPNIKLVPERVDDSAHALRIQNVSLHCPAPA